MVRKFLVACVFLCSSCTDQKFSTRPVLSVNQGRSLTLLAIGDSITAGLVAYPDRAMSPSGGYRVSLFKALYEWNRFLKAGLTFNYVGPVGAGPATIAVSDNPELSFDSDCGGLPGYRIDELVVAAGKFLETYHPKFILFMGGTNDLLQAYDYRAGIESLRKWLSEIITSYPDTFVFVASITPIRDPAYEERIKILNDSLRSTVMDLGSQKIIYTPLFEKLGEEFLKKNGCSNSDHPFAYSCFSDTVHPSPAGYDKIGQVWFDEIANTLSSIPVF